MTQLVDTPVAVPRPEPAAVPASGAFGRLLRFALANIRRRPERSVLAVAGIALAIAAVVVVRTVAVGYQVSGVGAVEAAVGGAPYWVVPAGGVRFDRTFGSLVPQGEPPGAAAPAGWTRVTTLAGPMPGHAGVLLVGRDGATAQATPLALRRLGVAAGATVDIEGSAVVLREVRGGGALVVVPLAVARSAGLSAGWATLSPPAGVTGGPAQVAAATGLKVTADPAQRPPAGSGGLVYATAGDTSRASFLTFGQKYAAMLGGQVGSSILGLVANVGLVLGFVIAVTSFVAAVHERRREFGIMAGIGLSDEVLYFFLVESGLVFLLAYVLGVLVGGAVVAAALPAFFALGSWLQAAGLVAMYLPALAVVAALVPVHRLLQQRPVDLLAVDQ
jgi:putative ABC transport system permease protein